MKQTTVIAPNDLTWLNAKEKLLLQQVRTLQNQLQLDFNKRTVQATVNRQQIAGPDTTTGRHRTVVDCHNFVTCVSSWQLLRSHNVNCQLVWTYSQQANWGSHQALKMRFYSSSAINIYLISIIKMRSTILRWMMIAVTDPTKVQRASISTTKKHRDASLHSVSYVESVAVPIGLIPDSSGQPTQHFFDKMTAIVCWLTFLPMWSAGSSQFWSEHDSTAAPSAASSKHITSLIFELGPRDHVSDGMPIHHWLLRVASPNVSLTQRIITIVFARHCPASALETTVIFTFCRVYAQSLAREQ